MTDEQKCLEWLKHRRDNMPMAGAKRMFGIAISALEKQEQDRWIPVTERLPEKDGHYLVTLFDEIDSWTEPLYWNTTFGGRWQGLIEDDFSNIGNVSAWRPLPEAYQEEES